MVSTYCPLLMNSFSFLYNFDLCFGSNERNSIADGRLLLTLKLVRMKKNRRKILSGSRKILFAILAMFLSLSASAQQITASGQVLDAQNEPLIGVSVQEKERLTVRLPIWTVTFH